MALTSASTFAEVLAEYKDTANYEINASAAEARRHVVAIRYLLVEMPNVSTKGSNSVGFSKSELQEQLKSAEEYARLGRGNRTGATRYASFKRIRSFG